MYKKEEEGVVDKLREKENKLKTITMEERETIYAISK